MDKDVLKGLHSLPTGVVWGANSWDPPPVEEGRHAAVSLVHQPHQARYNKHLVLSLYRYNAHQLMMDPVTIVSLAAAVAQFLDIGFRLVDGAKEIYESGSGMKEEVGELQLVFQDIKSLNHEITSHPDLLQSIYPKTTWPFGV